MSFISDLLIEISSFRIRVGNKLNALANRIGDLTALTTTNKNSLVEAVNEVNGKTDNIEIGGRNYFAFKNLGRYAGGSVSTNTSFFTISGIRISINSNPNDLLGNKVDVVPGSTILIHGKTNLPSQTVYYRFEGGSQLNFIVPTVNGRFQFFLTAPNNATYLNLGLGQYPYSSTYYLEDVKIEQGNKTTDWTPAPEDQVSDWNENDTTKYSYIKNKPTIPNGQLTVNTTSDLVGGYVYFPNGNVTTTIGIATHVLNAIANGQTAYEWGNHALAGYLTPTSLNNYYQSGDVNIPAKGGDYRVFPNNTASTSFDLNNIETPGFYYLMTNGTNTNSPKNGYWYIETHRYASSANNLTQYAHPYRVTDGKWMRSRYSGTWTPWVEFYHSGNFNPAQYVLQSALNTQLNNYATKAGTQTFTGQNTFTQAIYIPAATLNGHAVNLGQLNTILNGYATNENVAYHNDGDNVNSNVDWGSNVVGGAKNQIQGGRNIVKGEDINVFGSRNISSGINNQINGFANVANGAFNTINGAYSSINGSQSNTIGNYLFARDNQTVLGMYNKVYNVGDDEGLRVAIGTGSNDFDKFNAVEIYDDHRTEFHGKAQYNEETRNPEWFTEDYTHVDTYQVGYDHLPHSATGSTPCGANILRIAVRYGSNSASDDDRFTNISDLKHAFNVHGIVDGSIFDGTIDINRIHTKGTLEFSPATTTKLISDAKIDTDNLLIVRYNFGKGIIDIIGYTNSASLLSHKTDSNSVTVLLGSFILKQNDLGQPVAFFEFNQQII